MSDHGENQDRKSESRLADRDRETRSREAEGVRTRDDQNKKADNAERNDDKKKDPGGPPKKVVLIAGIIFVALALGGVLYYLHARNYVSTDDAFTAGHVHEISARVAGTVQAVFVNDNEVVRKGQALVALDPREFNLVLEKARAQLVQARATEQQAEAELTQRQAATAQASAQLWKAQTDYDRVRALYQRDMKAVAKAEVDANSAQLKTAQGELDAAKANDSAARAKQAVAQAGITTALAALHDAELQLSYTSIAAPVDGFVAKKTVETGRRVQPGQALMAVVEREVWVVANLKETQLAKVKIGQSVSIDIDAIPGREFEGRVDSFQPGTGATFSLLPPDNATGNFTKIVQRVPVKIVFDRNSVRGFENRIMPGLSAIPTIAICAVVRQK